MTKRLEDRQQIPRRSGGPVTVSLYEVGGSDRRGRTQPSWTVEVRRGGSLRDKDVDIPNKQQAARRYQAAISKAENGVYD